MSASAADGRGAETVRPTTMFVLAALMEPDAIRWRVETPVEAVEVLATRGLWPWPVGDDAAPRWWCEGCAESGPKACTTADPPTLAALVAVASLGVGTLLRAEALAGQVVGRAPRLVWRVMTRGAMRAWADGGAGRSVAEAPADVAAAWPVVRDLAALGATPVALGGDRVTLAVEAL